MTFNSLSILLINNIPDITDILYIERIVYSSTTYRGYRGDIGTIMPYEFFLHKKKCCFSGITGIYHLQITENQLFTPIYQILKWYIVKKSGIS